MCRHVCPSIFFGENNLPALSCHLGSGISSWETACVCTFIKALMCPCRFETTNPRCIHGVPKTSRGASWLPVPLPGKMGKRGEILLLAKGKVWKRRPVGAVAHTLACAKQIINGSWHSFGITVGCPMLMGQACIWTFECRQ